MDEDIEEILMLARENNFMLRQIIKYLNHLQANADSENNYDFLRNVIANLVSNEAVKKFERQ